MPPSTSAAARRRATWRVGGRTVAATCAALVLSLFAAPVETGSISVVTPGATSTRLSIYITGSGFAATAAGNEVTFIPASGPTFTATPSAIATVSTTLLRLTVRVPETVPVGHTAVRVRNTVTGELSPGGAFEVIAISLPDVRSASPGNANIVVRVAGSPNTHFATASTRVSFGAGITVLSTTVQSLTSLTATISVAATAALGPRTVALSGAELAVAVNAFSVVSANRNPVASAGGPYNAITGQPVTLDGSRSTDPDGDPLIYAWAFGDGATASGATPSHAYAAPGTYTATLTVTDGRGGTSQQSASISVVTPNHPPVARPAGPYSGTAGQLVTFDGSSSSDIDGDALAYAWDFGDGTKGAGVRPAHAYAAGTFTVTLVVNDGHVDSTPASTGVTVVAPNRPPTANAGGPYAGLVGQPVAFDGRSSSDPDGDPLSYAWQFGDATSASTDVAPSHAYAAAGSYTASLTVRDNRGGEDTRSAAVVITKPNTPPVANVGGPYTGVAGLPVSFSGSASSDPDGDALAYSWIFGDGAIGDGVAVAHTYQNAGQFSAALTVTDGRGGSHTSTFIVEVATAPLGRGVITGRVYDDATNLPLADSTAEILDAGGSAVGALATTSDPAGRYRLSAPPGNVRVRIRRAGYTYSDLEVHVPEGQRVDPDDARLSPLGTLVAVSAVAGGALTTAQGSRLVVPAGALGLDTAVRLTDVTLQAGTRHLPLGWSPVAIVSIDAGAAPLGTPATLTARLSAAPPGDITTARWDDVSGTWTTVGTASRASDTADIDIVRSGQYAYVIADAPPVNPPAAVPGLPLIGLSPRPPPVVQVTLSPAPRVLFSRAGARSLVTASARAAEPLASGTSLDLDLSETFTSTSDARLIPPVGHRRLSMYRAGASTDSLTAAFTVAPSHVPSPATLREGAIDLAARLPLNVGAPHGAVFGAAGGVFTAASGERVAVPPAASPEDLPVDVQPIALGDFPLAVPAGASLAAAFTLDLHGAPLLKDLTVIAAPGSTVAPDAMVLVAQLVDVGESTRLVLVATASLTSGRLTSTTDPLGTGAVRLPGIRTDGRYAFVSVPGGLGFVTGIVTTGGLATPGAIVDAGSFPIAAVTDAAGRYVVMAPAGSIDLHVTNPGNGDASSVTVVVDRTLSVTDRTVPIGPAVLAVIGVTPAAGAQGVALGSAATITFSKRLDPASVSPETVRLVAGGGVVLPGTLVVSASGTVVSFRPATLLTSETRYTLMVAAAVRDAGGHPLGAPFTSEFVTVDVTPPAAPPAGSIVASIPDGSGVSTITGTQGSADPSGVVIVRNLRTNALTTITPDAGGRFSGSVTALRTDRLEVTIKDRAGNLITLPVGAFRAPDGSTVVGAAGGRVDGAGGVFANIRPGLVPDGTIVRISPVTAADLPLAAPAEYPFIGGVRLELGGVTPKGEIDVGIAAPPGATPDEQILVARAISLRSGPAWTLAERAHLNGDGHYVTASPPFPGIVNEGVYAMFRPVEGCISYVNLIVQFVSPALIQAIGDAFIYTSDVQSVVIAKRCNASLNIQVRSVTTSALFQEIAAATPAANGVVKSVGAVVTDDHTAPTVVQANTFNGGAVPYVELVFSEPVNVSSVRNGLHVSDPSGTEVDGEVELSSSNTIAAFRPRLPFRFGAKYTISVRGATDLASNALNAQDVTFTPLDPGSTPPVSTFTNVASLATALAKCSGGACNTSIRDTASFGNVTFLANGLANSSERYSDFPPKRLVALDVKNPAEPLVIGSTGRPSNPRVLAAIRDAAFTTPQNLTFQGDLLLVASGGRILDNIDLPSRVEVYSVAQCTREPHGTNCLADVDTALLRDGLPARRGEKLLSTAPDQPPVPGVPLESGVPQQMAVLHQKGAVGTFTDTVAAYAIVSGVGLEAIDVTKSFNIRPDTTPGSFGPDGITRGDYLDVAVVRNKVFSIEPSTTAGRMNLVAFSAQLTDKQTIPLPGPAARLTALEGLVVDLDGDGRVGAAEADDQDSGTPIGPTDEIFDLVIVGSGPETTGCPPAVNPCGELYVLDVAALTIPGHTAQPRVIARIPMPGQPFSIQVDPGRLLAYVELRGKGLAVVDLSHLRGALQSGDAADILRDADRNQIDDRVLAVVPKTDIFGGEVHVDLQRGIAYVNGSTTGLSVLRVADCCTSLSLDFTVGGDLDPAGPAETGANEERLQHEKADLQGILDAADAALRAAGIQGATMLEQGSGACLWRSAPTLKEGCTAFNLGTSDHDIEVFVPTARVSDAQGVLDAYLGAELKKPDSRVRNVGPVTLYAFSKDAFESGELLVGTPLNATGDGSGDLAMGRQTLLLLWLLEGEYVTGHGGSVSLRDLLANAKSVRAATTNPIVPGQPSAIPRLEGYEWTRLQEYNFYKSGAPLRIAHVCERGAGTARFNTALNDDDVNDPAENFEENGVFTDDCLEQIRTIGKAGIRSVMARLVADQQSNPRLFDVDLDTYRKNGCRTGVDDIRHPPAAAEEYTDKPCGSFEEFIASQAIKSVSYGLFTAAELPQIFTFYCVKVGDLCKDRWNRTTPVLRDDAEINAFIAGTLQFIQRAQGTTRQTYLDTIDSDTKKIGNLPSLSRIATICQSHGISGLTAESPRSDLRKCNMAIVEAKVSGDPSVVVGQPKPFSMVTDKDARKRLLKHFGVRNVVFRDLRVRAVNRGSRPLTDLVVKAYEGDGLSTTRYTALPVDQKLDKLDERSARVIDRDAQEHPAFPAAFFLPDLVEGAPRAVTFFLDPDRLAPEAQKENNNAGFFYYRLSLTSPATPAVPDATKAPIADVGADPLCIPPSALQLTLLARHLSDVPVPPQKDIAVLAGQPVELQFAVRNLGSSVLTGLTISRSGADQPVVGPVTLAAGDAPAVYTATFTPDGPGPFEITARATAVDPQGNTVSASPSRVRVTITEPLCPKALIPLEPDPNTTDSSGHPYSSVMLGGRFFRYYKLIDNNGRPVAGESIHVQKREAALGGAFESLPDVVTGPDGSVIHPQLVGTGSEQGLRLSATLVGPVRHRMEFQAFAGDRFDSCGVTFTAEVKPREYTASLKSGASIEAEGEIEVDVSGKVTSGFEFALDRQSTVDAGVVTVTDTNTTVSRSIETEAGVGIRGATSKAGFTAGQEISIGKTDTSAELRSILMLRDRHEFTTPLNVTKGIAVGQLLIGLAAASAATGVPSPAGPLLSLVINELVERGGGLAPYRTGFGGGVGVKITAGADAPSVLNLSAGPGAINVGVEGQVDAAALGSIDVLLPANAPRMLQPSLEFRGAFDARASIGPALVEQVEGLAPDERDNLTKSAGLLLDLFQANGSASLAGTFRLSALVEYNTLRLTGITATISHKKRYGFSLAGLNVVDGGDNKVRKVRFTVTDKDPARLLEALRTLTLIKVLSEPGHPTDLLLGPGTVSRELVKFLSLADEIESRVEEGRGLKIPFGLEAFLDGVGAEVNGALTVDAVSSHLTQRETVRRSKRFTVEEYDEVDAAGLIPQNGFDAAIERIQTVRDSVKNFVQGYAKVTSAVSTVAQAARTAISWLFPAAGLDPEPLPETVRGPHAVSQATPLAGVELLVDGAAEPTGTAPFTVDLVAFQYRDKPSPAGGAPTGPSDIAGSLDRAHYGVGGFFHFSPSTRALAAPARLTIHYLDSELAGIDEQSLAIYRWNNVSQDWNHVGGTVNAADNSVTADVSQLGLYTLAPAMPAGSIAFSTVPGASGTAADPTTTVTFTSAPIRLNNGGAVPDGTLFTIRPLRGNRAQDEPVGTVLTPDAAPALDGVQVASQGGVIRFAAELPGAAGAVVPLAFAVEGTALADRPVTYRRPQ